MLIRVAKNADAARIAEIYNYYIAESTATFEESQVATDEVLARLAQTFDTELPWLVAESDGNIAGYAYASKWQGRCAYRYTAEVTIYLARDVLRRGIGTRLYKRLFDELRKRSYHTAIAGISLPNEASVALHEKFGMEKVAHFSEVGFKFNRWVDVGYWQVKLYL